MTKIARDYGNGNLQTTYEYGYTGDGVRVWKRDYLNQQEYRYLCRIECGGVPMRVYNRAIGEASWNTLEEYVDTPTAVWYGAGTESFSDYPMIAGRWLSDLPPTAGQMLYLDAFGLRVGGDFSGAAVPKRVPEYLVGDDLRDILKRIGDLIPKDYQDCVRKCKSLIPPFVRPRGFCEWLCARFFDPTPPRPQPKPEPPRPSPEPSPSPTPSPKPPKPKDCPPGTCKFVCPGKDPEKEFGCAPPGTRVECPDGTVIRLPENCDRPPSPAPSRQ